MPYRIVKETGPRPWKIYKKSNNMLLASSTSKKKAEAYIRARYANSKDKK